MSKTAYSGPLISWGEKPHITTGVLGNYNQDAGPSMSYDGWGLLDPRYGYFGDPDGQNAIGFLGTTSIPVLDILPATLADNNIAAAQVPVAATPMTLVSSTGAGITVVATALAVLPSRNVIPVNALAIDGLTGMVTFGQTAAIQIYDPTKAIARAVKIVSVADETGATFAVSGYDVYGYPMNETITGGNNATVNGKKAFKFIVSVTPAGTLSGSNVSVGTSDIYGLPIRADRFANARIVWNNTVITAATGFVVAVTTSPATATTGDVRGTYAVQSASDGAKRLQVFETPSVANIGSVTGLFGVTQF